MPQMSDLPPETLIDLGRVQGYLIAVLAPSDIQNAMRRLVAKTENPLKKMPGGDFSDAAYRAHEALEELIKKRTKDNAAPPATPKPAAMETLRSFANMLAPPRIEPVEDIADSTKIPAPFSGVIDKPDLRVGKVWTPEMRAAHSKLVKERIAAKKAQNPSKSTPLKPTTGVAPRVNTPPEKLINEHTGYVGKREDGILVPTDWGDIQKMRYSNLSEADICAKYGASLHQLKAFCIEMEKREERERGNSSAPLEKSGAGRLSYPPPNKQR